MWGFVTELWDARTFLLLLVSMASLLYLAENPGRPDVCSSIPESMWWSILALTGNGQVAPITLLGRLIASVNALAARRGGEFEPESIAADYDPSAPIITPTSYKRGPEGGVEAMSFQRERFDGARWHLEDVRIVGPVAVLSWRVEGSEGESARVSEETLVVRNGLIQMHFLQ